jgi:hypothetical protein
MTCDLKRRLKGWRAIGRAHYNLAMPELAYVRRGQRSASRGAATGSRRAAAPTVVTILGQRVGNAAVARMIGDMQARERQAGAARLQRLIYPNESAKWAGKPYKRLTQTSWYKGLTEAQQRIADKLQTDGSRHFTTAEADGEIARLLSVSAAAGGGEPASPPDEIMEEAYELESDVDTDEAEHGSAGPSPMAVEPLELPNLVELVLAARDAVMTKLPHGLGNVKGDIWRSAGIALKRADLAREFKGHRGLRDATGGHSASTLERAIRSAVAAELAAGARCAEAADMLLLELMRRTKGLFVQVVTDPVVNHAFVLIGDPKADPKTWVVGDAWSPGDTGIATNSQWWSNRGSWQWGENLDTTSTDYVSELVTKFATLATSIAPEKISKMNATELKEEISHPSGGEHLY